MAIDIKNLSQNQLDELPKRVELRKHELRGERVIKVRAKVVAIAKVEGFTIEELFGGHMRMTQRTKAAAKYGNPADHSQTWSGRGKRPRCFNAASSASKKEKDLLV